MISKKEVQHIAKLARLDLTNKEFAKMQKELSKILDYIEKLKEVDISKVEPTSHSVQRENVMRDDYYPPVALRIPPDRKIKKGQKLLKLAPETKDGYLKVKSIL